MLQHKKVLTGWIFISLSSHNVFCSKINYWIVTSTISYCFLMCIGVRCMFFLTNNNGMSKESGVMFRSTGRTMRYKFNNKFCKVTFVVALLPPSPRFLTQNIKILAQIVEMKYKYKQKEVNFLSCLAVNEARVLLVRWCLCHLKGKVRQDRYRSIFYQWNQIWLNLLIFFLNIDTWFESLNFYP